MAASALLSGCGKSDDKGDATSSGGSEYKSIGYVCSALGDKSFTDLSLSLIHIYFGLTIEEVFDFSDWEEN